MCQPQTGRHIDLPLQILILLQLICMRFSVIIFPGSNCDKDCVYVLKDLLKQDVVETFHETSQLPSGTDCVVLPGGFSYGDYLRSGAIARFSKINNSIIE